MEQVLVELLLRNRCLWSCYCGTSACGVATVEQVLVELLLWNRCLYSCYCGTGACGVATVEQVLRNFETFVLVNLYIIIIKINTKYNMTFSYITILYIVT